MCHYLYYNFYKIENRDALMTIIMMLKFTQSSRPTNDVQCRITIVNHKISVSL